jgi:hypothetical protein
VTIIVGTTKVNMSEEMNVDQIESSDDDTIANKIIHYSTQLIQQTIERALGSYLSSDILLINKFFLL